ncbi:MAG: phosphatidylglycerophosphatase A [Candidatus Omnitrophota bacterium]
MRNFIKLIATFFGVGYLPIVQGSFGSLASLLIFVFIIKGAVALHFTTFLIVTILGFFVAGPAEIIFKKKDSGHIVIDEVAGMLLSLFFIPFKPVYIFWAFFLFRLFDTIKPAPTEKFEKLSGSVGIMMDDLIAGIYTNICLQIVYLILAGNRLSA